MLNGYINCLILRSSAITLYVHKWDIQWYYSQKNLLYYITCIETCGVESPAVVTCPQTSEGVSTYPMVKQKPVDTLNV